MAFTQITKNQNLEVEKNIIDSLKLQRLTDQIPSKVSPIISPVLEVGRRYSEVINASGSITLTKPFALTSIFLSTSNGAAHTNTYLSYNITTNGQTTHFSIYVVPLAANAASQNINLFNPIYLEAGDVLFPTLSGTYSSYNVTITGYYL
jgi:hypothetical protein